MKRLEGVTICKEALIFFLIFFSSKPRSGRLEFVLMLGGGGVNNVSQDPFLTSLFNVLHTGVPP